MFPPFVAFGSLVSFRAGQPKSKCLFLGHSFCSLWNLPHCKQWPLPHTPEIQVFALTEQTHSSGREGGKKDTGTQTPSFSSASRKKILDNCEKVQCEIQRCKSKSSLHPQGMENVSVGVKMKNFFSTYCSHPLRYRCGEQSFS